MAVHAQPPVNLANADALITHPEPGSKVGILFRIRIFIKIFILFQAMCATLGNFL